MRGKFYDKIIIRCAFIYLFWMFFYGLIIKLTISNEFLFQIKTHVTDVMLILIMMMAILKTKKITKSQFFLASILLIEVLINVVLHGVNSDVIIALLYATRGFIAPMLVGYTLINTSIDEEEIKKFFSWLKMTAIVFLVGNTVLSFMQAIRGYEWTSQFYTGYSFYGTDQYSKVRISMASDLLRTPGITGAFTSSATYSLLCMAYLIQECKSKFFQIVIMVLTLMSIWFTYNKTVLVLYMIILILHLFINLPHTVKYTMLIIIFGGVGIGAIYIMSSMGIGVNEGELGFSTFARIEFWKSLSDIVSPLEMIVPYNMVNYAANGEGMLSCWDNFYLYCLFSFGVFGLYYFFKIIVKLYKINSYKKSDNSTFYLYLTIVLLLSGIFNNISNGKSFLGLFLIINGIVWRNNLNKKVERT